MPTVAAVQAELEQRLKAHADALAHRDPDAALQLYASDAIVRPENVEPLPGVAAVLSALIPGIGQFYNGDFLRGIFWLIVTPGLWLGSGGLLGWVCHVIAAITAHGRAQKKNRGSA